MAEFTIEIEEKLSRHVTVKADSLAEAISKVEDLYNNQEIVLDSNDYQGVSIREVSGEE